MANFTANSVGLQHLNWVSLLFLLGQMIGVEAPDFNQHLLVDLCITFTNKLNFERCHVNKALFKDKGSSRGQSIVGLQVNESCRLENGQRRVQTLTLHVVQCRARMFSQ